MMRRGWRGAIIGAAAAALVFAVATPASAHSQLISSTPAEGETLSELPDAFSVTMNEPLLDEAGLAAFAMQVRGDDGLYYGDGCIEVSGPTMSAPAAIGPAGDYVLSWQVVSADGHPVNGEVHFTWAGEATAEGTATPGSCGAEAPGEDSDEASGDDSGTDAPAGDTAVGGPLADVLWIGGAVLVVALAVVVTIVVTRRRR